MSQVVKAPSIYRYQAEIAVKDYYGDKAAIDPLLILAVISTLLQVIRFIKACRSSEEAGLEVIKHPTVWQRWQFKRIVKKACEENNVPYPRRKEVTDIVLSRQNKITQSEFNSLYYNLA